MSGGQVATKGFLLQALVAILDMLESDDWNEISVEPLIVGVDTEKVDIAVTRKNGTKEWIQVKHSKNPFSESAVKLWAAALVKDGVADKYRLALLGTPTSSVSTGVSAYSGVDLSIATNDVVSLVDAAAHRIARIAEKQGFPATTQSCDVAVENLVGTTLLGSLDGKPWKPEELCARILGSLTPISALDAMRSTGLEVSLRRILIVRSSNAVDDFITYTVRNHGPGSAQTKALRLCITDPGDCQVLRAWDGIRQVECGLADGPRKEALYIGLWTHFDMEVGAEFSCGVHLRRTGIIRPVGPVMMLPDVFLPTADLQEYTVFLGLGSGVPDARFFGDLTKSAARWAYARGMTSLTEQKPLSLAWEAVSAGQATDAASAAVDAAQDLAAALLGDGDAAAAEIKLNKLLG